MDDTERHWAGSAWTDRGTALLAQGSAEGSRDAVECNRKAVGLLAALPTGANDDYLADLGAAWANLGCALVACADAASLGEAVDAFSEATTHLGKLPFGASTRYRHNLAAAWMNKADALERIGGKRRPEAAQAYQVALMIAMDLPLDERASFRILLSSCWINYGNARMRSGEAAGAVTAFTEALAALGSLPSTGHRVARSHCATAWTLRSEALIGTEAGAQSGEAVASARQALLQIEGRDLGAVATADLSLRALRVLARALEQGSGGRERVGEATDIIERGLELALGCRERYPATFDPFVAWFFSFGCRVYGRYQPQFLAEFVEESLKRAQRCSAPALAAEVRSIALRAVNEALAQVGGNRVLVAGTRPTENLMGIVGSLRGACALLSDQTL